MGKEAERLGLVNQSVPLAELKETVTKMTEQIKGNSAQSIASIKTIYHFGSMNTMKEGLDFERNHDAEITDKKDNLKDFKKEI